MMFELKPRLIIVAGPNGSGKTTITEKLLRHEWMQGCEYVNPDIIAQQKFGNWNSHEAVIKAANEAQIIRDKCLKEKRSLAFETVFSSPEKLDFVKRAKDAGFFIRFFYVCTSDPTIQSARLIPNFCSELLKANSPDNIKNLQAGQKKSCNLLPESRFLSLLHLKSGGLDRFGTVAKA